MDNWEFTERYGQWMAIERESAAMIVAPTREELEEIIESLDE